MGRDDRRDGLRRRNQDSEERAEEDRVTPGVDDTLDRVRRLATNTAELLIVSQGGMQEDTTEGPSRLYLEALRERVDTGEYAILPRTVAEAMVRRADRLKKE